MYRTADIMEVFSSVQGEGPLVGERQLFIRFYGCNRSCAYCDTEASKGPVRPCLIEKTTGQGDFFKQPNPIGAEDLVRIVKERTGGPALHHSIAWTGGEPLLHARFLSEVLPALTESIPALIETNGTLYEELVQVLPWVEIISMDIKLASSTGEETDWESHRLFLERCRGKEIYVKVVVSPKVSGEEIHLLTGLIAETEPSISLTLQPLYGTEGEAAWSRRLLEIQARCKKRLSSVRVIPQVHKILKMS